jgi:hypothetical protein
MHEWYMFILYKRLACQFPRHVVSLTGFVHFKYLSDEMVNTNDWHAMGQPRGVNISIPETCYLFDCLCPFNAINVPYLYQ